MEVNPHHDQNCENLAECLATKWRAIFERLVMKGFSDQQAMLLLQPYVAATSMEVSVFDELAQDEEEDDD